jgi:hypothetical protein
MRSADNPAVAIAGGGTVSNGVARMSERRTSLLAALLVALGPGVDGAVHARHAGARGCLRQQPGRD